MRTRAPNYHSRAPAPRRTAARELDGILESKVLLALCEPARVEISRLPTLLGRSDVATIASEVRSVVRSFRDVSPTSMRLASCVASRWGGTVFFEMDGPAVVAQLEDVVALGGFGSAVSLAVVAVFVFAESVGRLASPVRIQFDQAIRVAVVGLVANLVSAILLRDHEEHEHGHAQRHRDHNLRGAYLHVLADALTSVLAIAALTTGKFLGWTWTDAVTGILGAIVIGRWSYGLLRDTGAVLLDAEVPGELRLEIQRAIEADVDNRVADLHLWRVGPRHLAATVSVVTHEPRDPGHYKQLLGGFGDLAHVTIEVNRCKDGGACSQASA